MMGGRRESDEKTPDGIYKCMDVGFGFVCRMFGYEKAGTGGLQFTA